MSLNKQANRRLWIDYKESEVRITLISGKYFKVKEYEETEEGYSFRVRYYYLSSDDNIYVSGISGGRDCDGYIERKYAFHITPEGDRIYADGKIYDPQAQQAGY